jgi:hypothetical protein
MRNDQSYARPGLADSTGDIVLLVLLTVALAVMAGTWLTGQLAALLFRGWWPDVGVTAAWQATLELPGHLADPRLAWSAAVRPDLPGPPGFVVAAFLTVSCLAAIVAGTLRWRIGRYPRQGLPPAPSCGSHCRRRQ